jgi:hypothetical protein
VFRFFKQIASAASAGTKAAAGGAKLRLLALEAKNLWGDAYKEAKAQNESQPRSFWGEGLRNELFWKELFERFKHKYRRAHPAPQGPELEVRCEALLDVVCETSLMLSIRLGMYTDAQLERIGEFFAVASACGVDNALLFDADRAALVYEYIPHEWLLATNFNRPVFDQWYSKETGKIYKPLS